MATLLVIDTATPACSVALFDGAALIASDYADIGRGHAERLVPMIEALPGNGRAEAIAINCGPGSFTGIRVGLSAALALGIAWAAPVRGYSTHSLMAHIVAQSGASGAISIVMQAGHGEVFVQNFTIDGGRISEEQSKAPISVKPDQAMTMVADRKVYGSGVSLLDNSMKSQQDTPPLPDARAFPTHFAQFATLEPKPIYVRAPDAKIAQPAKAQPVLSRADNG